MTLEQPRSHAGARESREVCGFETGGMVVLNSSTVSGTNAEMWWSEQ
jgi:hypothetical protein